MTRRFSTPAAVLFGLMLALPAALPAASNPRIFLAKTAEGQVWVSVDLALQRLHEPYVPFSIAVYNASRKTAVLDRDSFKIIGADGQVLGMPTIAQLRKRYSKQTLDLTMVRLYGMPFGTWLSLDRLVPSNFFPLVSIRAAGVRIDRVELPPLFWTVDLLYFPRPAGLDRGRSVTIEVAPRGWEHPVRVKVRLARAALP